MKPAASTMMKPPFSTRLRRTVSLYGWLYVFILPGIVLLFLFSYIPMLGVQIAFRDFVIYKGIWSGAFAGLKFFSFLRDPYFWQSFVNTISITGFRFLFGFPAPILLALVLNEVRHEGFKRTIQSISYLPHFISWIVVSYILYTMLQLDTGPANMLLKALSQPQVSFMGIPGYFRPIVVASAIWKEIGWGTIIYLAALAGIDPQLYEAAMLDGAGRFRRMLSINVPGIASTISILLILYLPNLLQASYDQIYPLVNPVNLGVSNVMDVYILRLGLTQAQYSVAAAMGLVVAVVNISLVLGANWLAKRVGQTGFW
jgi:putative aldouronate transport system permease protein